MKRERNVVASQVATGRKRPDKWRNKKRHTYYKYVLPATPVMENRKVEPANSLVFSTM